MKMMSDSAARTARSAARKAEDSAPFQALARVGYAVNGLLHVMIGLIAIGVATGAGGAGGTGGSGGAPADQSGALGQLAASPGGVFVLWAIVIGLAALGLWQVVQAFLVPAREPKRKWAHRAIELGKGVVYLAIAGTAFTFASGATSDAAKTTQDSTATLLRLPGGILVLVLLGLFVVVIGGFFVYRGAAGKFTDAISVPDGAPGIAIVALGVVGYVAKGIALGVVGTLFLVAAYTTDPAKATGLDGALKSLVGLPFGPVILIGVGVGLIAFGVYSFARARFARL